MDCNQVCPFNTLSGCKVNEYGAICPMSNMASEEKPMTNADRIRAMTDEELAKVIICPKQVCDKVHILLGRTDCEACALEWLKHPAEGGCVMALDKAISSGKEHRKPYRGSKRIDRTCRNHCSCDFCKGNRLYQTLKAMDSYKDRMKGDGKDG